MNKVKAYFCTVGDLSEQDKKNFAEWVWGARNINYFDPDVLRYPRTIITSAEDEGGALLYIPVQPVLMFESIAPRPELSPRKEALSLWRIGQMLEDVSKLTGYREQYCKDDRVADICAKHGFTEMEGYRILKKKIALPKDDEPKE